MRIYIVVAIVLVALGLVIAVWLLPDPRSWPDLDGGDRIQLVTLAVGFFALAATVVTVLAAVAEVRHVFPTQKLEVSTEDVPNQLANAPDPRAFKLVFGIPDHSPVINAYRVQIRLVRDLPGSSTRTKWSELITVTEVATAAEYQQAELVDEAENIRVVEMPDGVFGPTNSSFEVGFSRIGPVAFWSIDRDIRWFPGMFLNGPAVSILEGSATQYRWVVTWWTERQGPEPLVVPLE